jgi:hypothetical protein
MSRTWCAVAGSVKQTLIGARRLERLHELRTRYEPAAVLRNAAPRRASLKAAAHNLG